MTCFIIADKRFRSDVSSHLTVFRNNAPNGAHGFPNAHIIPSNVSSSLHLTRHRSVVRVDVRRHHNRPTRPHNLSTLHKLEHSKKEAADNLRYTCSNAREERRKRFLFVLKIDKQKDDEGEKNHCYCSGSALGRPNRVGLFTLNLASAL